MGGEGQLLYERSTPPQQYYDQYQTHYSVVRQAPKHSAMGIASFVIALISGLMIFAMIVAAGLMDARTPGGMDEEGTGALVIGTSVCFGAMAVLVGLTLGLAGVFSPGRNRTFAALGLLLNTMILVGVGGLMIIGAMST